MNPAKSFFVKHQENIRICLALISGFLVNIVFGALYTFGAILPYIASYIHYHIEPTITTTNLFFLFVPQLLFTNIGMIFSTYINKYIRIKVLAIVSLIGFVGCNLIISYLTAVWMYIIFYGILFGFSIGLGYLTGLNNCYSHLPNRKGLCSGVCYGGFGLSALVFDQILYQLVNPNNAKVDSQRYFPLQVANNVPNALRTMSMIYAGLGAVALLLFYQKKVPIALEEQNNLDIREQKSLIQKEQPEQELNFKYFIQKKLHFLILTIICISQYGFFVVFSYKQYGIIEINDDNFLTLLGSICSAANGIFRIIWGILFDKFKFKYIVLVIAIIMLACCLSMDFISDLKIAYFILVFASYCCFGGIYSLFPTQTVRIVGYKNGIQIYSFIYIGFATGGILQFFVHYFVILYYGEQGYIICLIIFGVFLVIGLILSVTVNYEYDISQKKYLV